MEQEEHFTAEFMEYALSIIKAKSLDTEQVDFLDNDDQVVYMGEKDLEGELDDNNFPAYREYLIFIVRQQTIIYVKSGIPQGCEKRTFQVIDGKEAIDMAEHYIGARVIKELFG